MTNYEHVLSFDPSGSFEEGKGISGYCLMDLKTGRIIRAGIINAKDYKTAPAYWNDHLNLIWEVSRKYPKHLLVLAEDYILYKDKAESQTNSKMETCRLLGIMEHYCWSEDLHFLTQTASQVVNRWNNDVLVFKKILYFEGKRPHLTVSQKPVSRHTLDAIRHALHYKTFGIKKEKKHVTKMFDPSEDLPRPDRSVCSEE